MPSLTVNRAPSAVADLVIHHFDQWSNSGEPTFAPTSICWYEPESDSDER